MEENPTETKIALPAGFLLGAASSSHQVEGDNFNSDWWMFEQQGKLPKSGKAADHYNRYDEDFKLAAGLGLKAMRISIEWSRIEPVEGRWDSVAIEHYRKVLKSMKEAGLVRMVTLFHFTLPQWLSEKRGFETAHGIEAFARFSWFVAQNLGDEIDLWVTINEPEVYSQMGYLRGIWPPFERNVISFLEVFHNLMKAHRASFAAIKQVRPQAQIGLAKNNVYYEAYRGNNIFDRAVAGAANYFGNLYFLNRVKKQLDFIGLNYYFYERLKLGWKIFKRMTSEGPKSDMGWRTFPEGIFHLLVGLKKYKVPLYITENGIANARDDMRKDFIRQHLEWVSKAVESGADVKGYFYWTLTDTYEWQDGFNPKFGLIEVDLETQARKIRPSAEVFKEIA
ncbi:MAG: glycoside hydrolase family 1 protein [Acidobacteriaceae bacterium]